MVLVVSGSIKGTRIHYSLGSHVALKSLDLLEVAAPHGALGLSLGVSCARNLHHKQQSRISTARFRRSDVRITGSCNSL